MSIDLDLSSCKSLAYPMMSSGKGTCAINIGRFKTYKVRTKLCTSGGEKSARVLTVTNSLRK
jgi:hypothetical protein